MVPDPLSHDHNRTFECSQVFSPLKARRIGYRYLINIEDLSMILDEIPRL